MSYRQSENEKRLVEIVGSDVANALDQWREHPGVFASLKSWCENAVVTAGPSEENLGFDTALIEIAFWAEARPQLAREFREAMAEHVVASAGRVGTPLQLVRLARATKRRRLAAEACDAAETAYEAAFAAYVASPGYVDD